MRKLKNSKGVTLAEMLFCVLILSILAILILTGSKAIKRSLTAMEEQYRANALADNLLTVITEELRYSRNLTIEFLPDAENEITKYGIFYISDTYGENTVLKAEPFGTNSSYGCLTITYRDKVKQTYLPCESLYKDLWICLLDDETPMFRWDSDGEGIMVSFGICNEDGERKASIKDTYVRLLNVSD